MIDRTEAILKASESVVARYYIPRVATPSIGRVFLSSFSRIYNTSADRRADTRRCQIAQVRLRTVTVNDERFCLRP